MARDSEETRRLSATRDLGRKPWAEGFVAESREMARVLRVIERLRDSELPVLLTGESGTGKDHVARLIHQSSRRSDGPLLTQNCSSLSPGRVTT